MLDRRHRAMYEQLSGPPPALTVWGRNGPKGEYSKLYYCHLKMLGVIPRRARICFVSLDC